MIILNTLTAKKIEENKEFNYLYRVTENTLNNTKVFGIEIERIDFIDQIVTNIERDSIKFISPKREKVLDLVKILYKNEVSPIHLVDVIGEYVDESVIDFEKVEI